MIVVSIIVPTFNGGRYLAPAIQSLVHQDFSPRLYEILVVDNRSTDRTADIVREAQNAYPEHSVRYIYEPIPGLLSGRHRGVREAHGSILVFVDDDILANIQWLSAITEAFASSDVKLVTGPNLPQYQEPPPKWLNWLWNEHEAGRFCGYLSLLELGGKQIDIDPQWVWGLNFAVHRSTLKALGGFHPDAYPKHLQIFQGDGEIGLTAKARAHGYRAVYHPLAEVRHQISPKRVCPAHFKNRNYFQGICDSYTEIRRICQDAGSNSFSTNSRPSLLASKETPPVFQTAHFQPEDTDEKAVQSKTAFLEVLSAAHRSGFDFHQQAVSRCAELFTWVVRRDYWDYGLPQIVGSLAVEAPIRSY